MSDTVEMQAGGYGFIPGVFQYSAGVVALPGFAIERARFPAPLPMAEGFRRIGEYLQALGRPLSAFCACEMRSPAPFTEAGFRAFNEQYAGTLTDWGIHDGRVNPVARANVCPEYNPLAAPGFHAFCYTVAAPDSPPTFVVAGSGEAPEGKGNYRDHIIARGDLGPAGLRRKAAWVLGEMERRMGLLGGEWADTTAVQVYTVHDIYPLLGAELAPRGVLRNGFTWHLNRPPVVELEFEMDCRRVLVERVLA